MTSLNEKLTTARLAKVDEAIEQKMFYTKVAKKQATEILNNLFSNATSKEFESHDLSDEDRYSISCDIPFDLRFFKVKHIPLLNKLGIDPKFPLQLKDLDDLVRSLPVIPVVRKKVTFKATKNQATHLGTCQVCGRLHKVSRGEVDSGLVAKHGYNVDNGYFNQVCYGAEQVPFEVSKDHKEKYIISLESTLDSLIRGVSKTVSQGIDMRKTKIRIRMLESEIGYNKKQCKEWVKKDLTPIQRWA